MAGLVCAKQIVENSPHLFFEDHQIRVDKTEHRIVVNGTIVVGEEIPEINDSSRIGYRKKEALIKNADPSKSFANDDKLTLH